MIVTPTTAPAPTPGRPSAARRELGAFASLLGLSGLAITQPALELLGNNSEILLVNDVGLGGALLIALAFALIPACSAYTLEVVVGLVIPPARRVLHAALAGSLIGLLALEVAKRLTAFGPTALVAVAIASGILGALAILRSQAVSTWTAYLAPAPIVFVAAFLFASPAAAVITPEDGDAGGSEGRTRRAHRVVLVTFDELPLATLLDGSGGIDRELFPNFAALADSSTWYRNSTANATYTHQAVPPILTGEFPESGDDLPVVADHPDSIFTMLSDYSMNVHESLTRICPASRCTGPRVGAGGTVPAGREALRLWARFAAPRRTAPTLDALEELVDGPRSMDRFAASIRPGRGRHLDFLHAVAPHQPWRFYPDGTDYEQYQPPPGSFGIWSDAASAEQARVRHVVQTMDTDRRLGTILTRLRRTGAWDDALVVVTADHGIAFSPREGTRSVTGDNWPEIMWTPLFVKYPNQQVGRVDDRPAQAVDVLPTIADVVGAEAHAGVDGRSLRRNPRSGTPRRLYQFPYEGFEPEQVLRAPNGRHYFEFDEDLGFQQVLGKAAAPPGGPPPLRPYRIGPYGTLVGRAVDTIPRGTDPTAIGFSIEDPARILSARATPGRASWGFLRGFVSGTRPGTHLALAVNGRVAAVLRASQLNADAALWSTLIEPSGVRAGTNIVKLYEVTGGPDAARISEIPYAGAADL